MSGTNSVCIPANSSSDVHSVGKIDQCDEMVLEPVTTLPGHAVAVRSLVKGNNFYTRLINYTDSDI